MGSHVEKKNCELPPLQRKSSYRYYEYKYLIRHESLHPVCFLAEPPDRGGDSGPVVDQILVLVDE